MDHILIFLTSLIRLDLSSPHQYNVLTYENANEYTLKLNVDTEDEMVRISPVVIDTKTWLRFILLFLAVNSIWYRLHLYSNKVVAIIYNRYLKLVIL